MNPGRPVLGRIALGALRYRVTGRRAPLVVFLSVTNRCDALCGHCAIPLRAQKELTTRELVDVVDAIARRGCQALVITGGEPTYRRDLDVVLAHARARGLFVRLETNGYEYPNLAAHLGPVGQLVIGLEGDEATHDAQREPGAFARAIHALAAAEARRQRTATVTVLTRHNVGALDAVLDVAAQYGAMAEFRLLNHNRSLDGGTSADLAPSAADTRRALRWLVEARRQGRPVGTPEKTLRTLIAWPDYAAPTSPSPREDLVCMAGQTHCYVDADGSVFTCHQRVGASTGVAVAKAGFDVAFDALRHNECQACAQTDLCQQNHLSNLNGPTLLGLLHSERLRDRISTWV